MRGSLARGNRFLSEKHQSRLRWTREAARLQLPSRDPADHFLAATAQVFELTLATADQQLLKTPGLSLLANR